MSSETTTSCIGSPFVEIRYGPQFLFLEKAHCKVIHGG